MKGISDAERARIVDLIAADPTIGSVIRGTGGCRTVRVAGRGLGKSGGYRVVTFFSGPTLPAFLITVYSKGFKDDLTDGERNGLVGLGAELVAHYTRRVVPLRRRP